MTNKKCGVVMLPTNQASNIWLRTFDGKLGWDSTSHPSKTAQHLYFLSQEEIKEGDWHYCEMYKQPKQASQILTKRSGLFKVIATTNPELHTICTNCGYLRGNSSTCKKCNSESIGIPKIRQSFIDKFIEQCNLGKPIEWVNVELDMYDDPNWVLNDSKRLTPPILYRLKLDKDGCVITHKIQDSFSREEVIAILQRCIPIAITNDDEFSENTIIQEWFNKNY